MIPAAFPNFACRASLMVVVHNEGDTRSAVTLRIPYTTTDNPSKVPALDPIELVPGEVRELSPEVQGQTSGLDSDRLLSGGMEVAYSTAPGTVLAMAQSVSRDRDHVFRAPMNSAGRLDRYGPFDELPGLQSARRGRRAGIDRFPRLTRSAALETLHAARFSFF